MKNRNSHLTYRAHLLVFFLSFFFLSSSWLSCARIYWNHEHQRRAAGHGRSRQGRAHAARLEQSSLARRQIDYVWQGTGTKARPNNTGAGLRSKVSGSPRLPPPASLAPLLRAPFSHDDLANFLSAQSSHQTRAALCHPHPPPSVAPEVPPRPHAATTPTHASSSPPHMCSARLT